MVALHEGAGLGEIGRGRPGAERQALGAAVGELEHPARTPGDLGNGIMPETVNDLIECRRHRRQGRELADQFVAGGHRLLALDRVAVGIEHGTAHQVAFLVGEGFLQLHREGMGEIVEHKFTGREIDGEIVPFRGRYLRDPPFHQRFVGGDELHHRRAPGVEIGLDGTDEARALHGGQQMAEEALLGALEGRECCRLGVAVEGIAVLHDAGRLERHLEVGVNDLEGLGIGIVDAPLFRRQRMLQDVDLDTVVAERPGLVEAEGLEIARDHLHRRHPAGLHGDHEIRALFEGGLSASPEAEALGISKAGNGSGPGGGDIHDPGIGQCVLEPQSGAALLRGRDLSPRALGPGGVGHGVSLVEHDDALEGMARVFIHPAGEPADDLVQARGAALPGRGAQRRVSGKQYAGIMWDLGSPGGTCPGG